MLLIAAIVLIGWIAITASHIVADLYLLRFRLDVADNLLARKHVTQVRVLRRVVDTLLIIVTVGAALMTFEPVRQYGVSLFASAGVAGLVVGLAARPVLSNLIAGIQLAVTQPIRIDDAVVVENESGRVEEITSTYVVVRLWDLRRMIVPLTYFIEKPFQNWTRESDEPDRRRAAQCRLHDAGRSRARQGGGDRQGLAAVGRQSDQAAGHRLRRRDHGAARDRQRPLLGRRLRSALRDAREADRLSAGGTAGIAAAPAAGSVTAAGADGSTSCVTLD